MNRSDAGKKGYDKTKDLLDAKREEKSREAREQYEANPKVCVTCGNVIPYEKRANKFCSRFCAASHNNLGKVRVKTTRSLFCANCGSVKDSRQNKYCKACIEAKVYSNKIAELDKAGIDRTRKRILLEMRGHRCESCGYSTWLEQPIPLELHHIDGDPDNNSEVNLCLICPNCHALTDSYKGANAGGNSSRQLMRRNRYKDSKTY